jgi:diphthine synthase
VVYLTFGISDEAIRYLLKVESIKRQKIFSEKTFCVGCARIGGEKQIIKSGRASELIEYDFGKPPHCLIVTAKLHFMEEEMLRYWNSC